MVRETYGIQTINHEQLKKIIKRAYAMKKPLFIWGTIGIGKSWTTRDAAREIAEELQLGYVETKQPNKYPDKFCLVDFRLAQRDPSDLLGLPETYAVIIDRDTKTRKEIPVKALNVFLQNNNNTEVLAYITKWNFPSWLPLSGHGIIFLDELNLAPQLVQGSAYEMIYDRRLGDWICPDGWIVIGAGNRGIEDRVSVFEMGGALDNRFCHCQLRVPSVEEWTEWAIKNYIDHRIIAYLNAKQSALFTFSSKSKEKAFATPRTWHYTSDMIRGIDNLEDIQLYASTTVGTYVAAEFINFLRLQDKIPPIIEYIKNPDKTPIPESNDLLYSLCASLAEYFRTHKDKKTLTSIVKVSKRLTTEFMVFLLKLCKTIHEEYFKDTMPELKEAKSVLYEIGKYLL